MPKKIAIVLLLILFVGCAKREPNAVLSYQPGDEARSCDSIATEISYYQNKINIKQSEATTRIAKNTALGAAGLVFIVPWFFMDLSNAENTELESYKMRIERLQFVAIEKKCNLKPVKFDQLKQEESAVPAEN